MLNVKFTLKKSAFIVKKLGLGLNRVRLLRLT